MKVERLTLRNFRNIKKCCFEPHPGLNLLVGPNGQGKTSFLEAIGYLAVLRSFCGSKSADVIQYGEEFSEISCTLGSNPTALPPWQTDLKISFVLTDPEKKRATKTAFINGKLYRSSTQYLSQRFGSYELGFHAVIFNPSDHDLVRGDPAKRRSYLDQVISSEDIEYLKNFQKYHRILEQRNAMLKADLQSSEKRQDEWLGFTEPLCRYGALLVYQRLLWIKRLENRLKLMAHKIAPQDPELHFEYLSSWVPKIDELFMGNNNLESLHFTGHRGQASLELLEQAFWKEFSVLEKAEWQARHTLVGPHRDDWTFVFGNHALKGHGSQGEIRTALLALKLSELELFRDKTGHRPLFLLDDFSSELDRDRRSFLLDYLSEMDLQVFVTTTEDIFFAGKRYWVFKGGLREGLHDDGRQPSGID